MRQNVLIINSLPSDHLEETASVLSDALHYQVSTTASVEDGMEWLRVGRTPFPDVALLNVHENDGDKTLGIVHTIKKMCPELPVLLLFGYGQEVYGMEAVKAGVYDFMSRPVSIGRLKVAVENALRMRRMSQYITWLERKVAGHTSFEDIIGESLAVLESLTKAQVAALSREPVWLDGEAGTGKTLVARAIHGSSDRAGKPFIIVNCELLPKNLTAEILFGQEKQPSDSTHFVLGKIREADQGTLLLQEVGSLAPELWQRLLDTLRSRALTPQGGLLATPVNCRLICTDSLSEKYRAASQTFLQQLGNGFEPLLIRLPTLVDRKDDIRILAEHFLLVYATSENKFISRFTDRAMDWLEKCHWPGNVGELANTIWRAVMLCEKSVLDIDELRTVHKNRSVYLYTQKPESALTDEKGRVKSLKSVQQDAIRAALQQEGGCMTRAARSLGIGRSTLYRKVSEYSLNDYISRANQTTRPMMNVSSMERS